MEAVEEADKPMLTLGISSQLSGVPAHSIQQYINMELLIPFKLNSNRHLFSKSDLNRLRNISILLHERGLNFAGIRSLLAMIPCWAITECPKEVRQKCNAYYSESIPCWEASEKNKACRNLDCRECEAYTLLNNTVDMKAALKEVNRE